MRRPQKTHSWQRKQQPGPRANWFPVAPLVYGCAVPPAKVLAHKYVRILKRLAKGEKLQRVGKFWKWIKTSGGKVKATLLFAMRSAGLLNCIGGNWLPTAQGIAAASNVPSRRVA